MYKKIRPISGQGENGRAARTISRPQMWRLPGHIFNSSMPALNRP